MHSHDAIVIGSSQAGQKVALIEREHNGGTCVNDGCIPTKAQVRQLGGQIEVVCNAAGTNHTVIGSHLLLATGRQANTDDLGLPAAGIAAVARGFITVDDQLQTSVPGVWALGDVSGRGAFTHTSYNDFEIVAANLLRSVNARIPAYALFIDPPLGRVGMSEAQVRATGRPALVGGP